MSCDSEENNMQCVVSLPNQQNRLNLKTINLKLVSCIPPSFKSKILRNLNPDPNFTSVSLKRSIENNDAALKFPSKVNVQDGTNSSQILSLLKTSQISKRLKTNISMEVLPTAIVGASDETSEILGTDKLSDGIGTEVEWDKETLEELRSSELPQNTSKLVILGKKNNSSGTEVYNVNVQDGAKSSQTQSLLKTSQISKQLKTNISMEVLPTDILGASDETSEILGNDKLSDEIGTEDDWDEGSLEELRSRELSQNTSKLVTLGKEKNLSGTEVYSVLENSNLKKESASVERRKGKPKHFRTEWLDIDIFKDWLDKDPNNPNKARCIACNTTMNAGKSELEKHATGARHCQNLEIMKNQHYLEYEKEEVSDMLNNVQVSMGEEESYAGEEVHGDYRDQQLEALHRIATSVDTLSTNVAVFFEKLCSNQETLIQILQQLVPK